MSRGGWMTQALEQKCHERADRLLRAAHHEAGHAVINHLTGARVNWITLVPHERRVGLTQASFVGVDLVDVLVGFAAGRAATTAMGWPKPENGAEDDARRERLIAIQLAHLSRHGKATDLEYVDGIVDAGREEADRLAKEHWQAIDALAKVLVQRLRVGGAEEVGALIDRSLLKVPSVAAREAAFQDQWNRFNVRHGYARRLRYA
jgi:hypothetical protein